MAYNKQNFEKGQVLEAEHLNHMEEGIAANETAIAKCQPKGNYLTEHQELKTINGQSVVGSGNMEITADVTDDQIAASVNDYLSKNPVEAYVDYDRNVHSVNHRGYSSSAPENTLPAYIMSRQKGFTYVEADVSFTSDGVPVLLHDATIDRTSNGSGKISEMTFMEASQYDYGSWKNAAYAGTRIPTFAEFLTLCKQLCLHPYIELKDNGDYTQEQIQELVGFVKSCGMDGKVSWISFSDTFLKYVKNADSKARLGYLSSSNVSAKMITTAQGLQTGENEVFLDLKYSDISDAGVALAVEAAIPLEVWTVNSESAMLALNPYVTGITSDNLIGGQVLYDKGLVYEYGLDVVNFTITNDLTNVSTDNATNSVLQLEGYSATLTVDEGFTLSSVVVTMGGVDVTADVYADGVITIPSVTGNVVITAVALNPNARSIIQTLTNVTSSNQTTNVEVGDAFTTTLTVRDKFEMTSVVVTMGGVDITSEVYANGVITIPNVTDNVVIVATASVVVQSEAVVDLAMANVTDGVLRNVGTGGSTYDATITNGEYTSDANSTTLIDHAYADVPYALNNTDPFTVVVRGSMELAGRKYERLMRTETDAPSIYYHKTKAVVGAKLAGVTGDGNTAYNDGTFGGSNTAYAPSSINVAEMHTYVFTSDGTTISWYIDGLLRATQNVAQVQASTRIGIGDNDPSASYYANKVCFEAFRIYNYAMIAEEVEATST